MRTLRGARLIRSRARRFVATTVRASNFADHRVAGLAIHEREDAVLVGRAQDGVAFQVPDTAPVLRSRGPFGDRSFACQPASAVVAAVPFSARFSRPSEVVVEEPTASTVLPDVAVDGLVADREDAGQREPAGDLLRAPVLLQAGLDNRPGRGVELAVAPRSGASPPCQVIGSTGPIPAIAAGGTLI